MSDYPHSRKKSSSATLMIVVAVVLALLAVAFFVWKEKQQAAESTPVVAPVVAPAVEPVQSQPEVAPMVTYEPPAPVVEEEPLPALNESDKPLLDKIAGLGSEGLLKLIIPPEVIRKFVIAVNGVSEGKIVTEYRPVVSPAPPFVIDTFTVVVDGEAVEQIRISPKNFDRYQTYVTALALMDPDAAVKLYQRFYPLLEEAFKELGLKKSNFHSVLIAAIDNLLAAPNIDGDVLLIQPKVFYQFADPALEAMPQTHKLMVRMGPENERSLKASLRQLRAKLMAQ